MEAQNTEQKRVRTISANWVTIIATLITLFCPLAVQFYNYRGPLFGDITIVAMAWIYYSNSMMGPFDGLMISPFLLLQSLPFTFMRFVFGYMLYQLYSRKSTIKRVMLIGIAMELFLPVFYFIIYLPTLFMNPGWFYIPWVLPIPILLLYGIAIVKGYPPPQEKFWIETEKNEYWWENPKGTEAPMKIIDSTPQTDETAFPPDGATTQTNDDWLNES